MSNNSGQYSFKINNEDRGSETTVTKPPQTTQSTFRLENVKENKVNDNCNASSKRKNSINSDSGDSNVSKQRKRRSGGKHQMAACCSCKRRRKKCDGKYPVCSGCARLGHECTIIFSPTGKEIKRDYLETLENTVESLRSQINYSKPSTTASSELMATTSISMLEATSSLSSSPSDLDITVRYPPTAQKNKDLAQEVGFITLGAAGEPRYIGETSAYSIAKAISSSINCYSQLSGVINSHPGSSFTPPPPAPFRFPTLEIAKQLLTAYKDSVQCQYPFLDWPYILACFHSVMKDKSTCPLPNFFIFMIFAIGSQLTEPSRATSSSQTKGYYFKAFEYVDSVVEILNLRTVQAYLLMAVFSQKMPDGTSVWQTTGLAIRIAVALGIHREPYRRRNEAISNEQRQLEDLKSRVFWSAYGIERINGLVLGRPFSISDIDIDAPFPLETEETRVACHVVKLRRIQSSICSFIYNPIRLIDKREEVDSTRVQILLELNDWMATFPYKDDAISTFETNNWSLISYHNSVLLLLRPLVLEVGKLKNDSPKRYIEWFKVFTESSSAVCINYKNMHLRGKLGYTWLAMHCCFVAGISFLYCIWLDNVLHVLEWKRQSLIYEAINACSSILYVLAERWKSASIFRDTFERLSNIVKSGLENSDNKANANLEDILKTGVFVDGSIEIDHYLKGAGSQERFKHRTSMGGDTDGMLFTPTFKPKDVDEEAVQFENMDSLWEFLDSTGDRFLRNIFNEMEDGMSYS